MKQPIPQMNPEKPTVTSTVQLQRTLMELWLDVLPTCPDSATFGAAAALTNTIIIAVNRGDVVDDKPSANIKAESEPIPW